MQDIAEHKPQPAPVLKYVGIFALVYAGLYIALTLVSLMTGVDLGRAASIAMLAVAGVMTGGRFGKDQGRFFVRGERWRLVLGCLLASYLVSVAGAVLLLTISADGAVRQLLDMIDKVGAGVWLVLIAIVSLLYYLGLYLCLGMGAKSGVRQAGPSKFPE